jgi:hypothetical protein
MASRTILEKNQSFGGGTDGSVKRVGSEWNPELKSKMMSLEGNQTVDWGWVVIVRCAEQQHRWPFGQLLSLDSLFFSRVDEQHAMVSAWAL